MPELLRRLLLLLPLLSGCGSLPAASPPPAAAGAPGPAAALFTEATEAAGIRFTHTNGGFGAKYMPEPMGAGCAFLDFDGDGWLDILLLNGTSLQGVEKGAASPAASSAPATTAALYRNNGDGTFTDATAGSGLDVPLYAMGCAVGDYDNDGRDDLFLTVCNAPNRLFRNEGGGRFRDVTAAMGVGDRRFGTSCAWLDYDRDGWLDLFVCNYARYEWGTSDRSCIHPMDRSRAYCDPRHLAGEPSLLYRNEGGRRFREVTAASGIGARRGKALGVAVCDYNQDGWPDLLVANDLEPNFVFRNRGDGTFQEIGLEAGIAVPESGEVRAGMGIDAAEPLEPGRCAVLVSNFSGEGTCLYVQDQPGAGAFTDAAPATGIFRRTLNAVGFGLFFFDYDNDGWLDAFQGNGHIQPDITRYLPHLTHGQRNLLFRNEGGARFEETGARIGGPFTTERVTRGAAFGDYDNDGDLDILLSNNNQPAELLRNNGEGRSGWLQLDLVGTRSGRNALGARVEVTAEGRTRRGWVRSGSSYLSQSMRRLHFGLGGAARAEKVEVHWPRGGVTVLRDVAANRRLTVREDAPGDAGAARRAGTP